MPRMREWAPSGHRASTSARDLPRGLPLAWGPFSNILTSSPRATKKGEPRWPARKRALPPRKTALSFGRTFGRCGGLHRGPAVLGEELGPRRYVLTLGVPHLVIDQLQRDSLSQVPHFLGR